MNDVIALIVLILIFVVATVRAINMGALALAAAAVVGVTVFGSSADDVLDGFPTSLFIILVGVTYLFALARNNGTVDWLIQASIRTVRGRVAWVPWAMFLICALIAGIGAAVPATVAILAPVAMGFASQYRIRPVLMAIAISLGAGGGSFSPIGIFGAITNGVVQESGLPSNPILLFAASMGASFIITLTAFVMLGGGELVRRGRDNAALAGVEARAASAGGAPAGGQAYGPPESAGERAGGGWGGDAPTEHGNDGDLRLNRERVLTLAGLVLLAVTAFALQFDVGFTAIVVAVVLTLIFPKTARGAVDKIAWGTVLLVTGIVTYVNLLDEQGTVGRLGEAVATIGAPLIAALLICFIGAIVSAFASTTGILGALIPLAVPFLLTGQVSAVGLIIALAISSSVVDISPFSTSGAMCVANADQRDREEVFRKLVLWGLSLVVLAPPITWVILVVPGWL